MDGEKGTKRKKRSDGNGESKLGKLKTGTFCGRKGVAVSNGNSKRVRNAPRGPFPGGAFQKGPVLSIKIDLDVEMRKWM